MCSDCIRIVQFLISYSNIIILSKNAGIYMHKITHRYVLYENLNGKTMNAYQ